ncbi:P1 family peptidase [Benzoatithermus flavus]|uniref:P1 family peptidase n=1 Tax=Benzoatithermus flavus TaxID=3108223 RepID=UPI003AB0CA81
MIRPGPRNSLTDIEGLLVGNAEDVVARTGVTAILAEPAAMAAVDVRGGATGTINASALALGGLVREVHGIALSGGSTFGLEAASGLMGWLAVLMRPALEPGVRGCGVRGLHDQALDIAAFVLAERQMAPADDAGGHDVGFFAAPACGSVDAGGECSS